MSGLLLGVDVGTASSKGVLSEPLFALLAGALDLVDLAHFGDLQTILEYATLAVALMGVALRLPERYSLRNGRLLLVLLGCLMPLMWAALRSVTLPPVVRSAARMEGSLFPSVRSIPAECLVRIRPRLSAIKKTYGQGAVRS